MRKLPKTEAMTFVASNDDTTFLWHLNNARKRSPDATNMYMHARSDQENMFVDEAARNFRRCLVRDLIVDIGSSPILSFIFSAYVCDWDDVDGEVYELYTYTWDGGSSFHEEHPEAE